MVPSWADQLLLQLWMEQFDTLPIQCRHIEHMHEGVGFRKNNFWQNYSYENLDNFSLIRLLNMHRWCLLNLTVQGFSLNLTVRGVSNKHCLVTFFIVKPNVVYLWRDSADQLSHIPDFVINNISCFSFIRLTYWTFGYITSIVKIIDMWIYLLNKGYDEGG